MFLIPTAEFDCLFGFKDASIGSKVGGRIIVSYRSSFYRDHQSQDILTLGVTVVAVHYRHHQELLAVFQ